MKNEEAFHTARKSVSPPSRRRGLKKLDDCGAFEYFGSPPSRRRGLKSFIDSGFLILNVASFAEAWIEKFETLLYAC